MSDRFTIVFEGDVRKLSFSPLKEKTRYGTPVSLMYGDALVACDEQTYKLNTARAMLRECAAEFESIGEGATMCKRIAAYIAIR